MHEMRVIYNPKARRGRYISQFDKLAEAAQFRGFRLSLYRLSGQEKDTQRMLSGLQDNSILVTCGGDGTLPPAAWWPASWVYFPCWAKRSCPTIPTMNSTCPPGFRPA